MALTDNAWYLKGSTGVTACDLGSASNSAGATLTLSITVPAGATIVVVASEVTSASAGTMSDATNGAYTVATSGAMSGAAGFGMIFEFVNSAALSAVTLTYTKQTSGRACSISAMYLTGIATTTPRDTAVTATTAVNSASPTVTSGTPTQNGNLTIGACAYSNAAAKTLTNTGSFTVPFANNTGQSTASCGGGHLNVNGTLATTFNPTLSGASDNITMIVGYKPANATLVGWWNVTKWAASNTQHCGDLIRQNATPNLNAERVFVCIASTGGTGTTAASEPAWTTTAQATRGAKFTDNTVTWQEATGIAALNGDLANTPNWTTIKNTAITLGQVIQNNAGNLILICTTAGTAGNGAEPSWAAFTNAGATTADNTATWTTLGANSNFTIWNSPHARFNNMMTATWGVAGNKFFASSLHSEVQTSTNTLVGVDHSLMYSVKDSPSSTPPGSGDLQSGATISTTGTTNCVFGAQSTVPAYFYGLILNAGTGTGNVVVGCSANLITFIFVFDTCAFNIVATGSTSTCSFSANHTSDIKLINTTLGFAAVGQTVLGNGSVRLTWENTASAITGTVPTTLFYNATAGHSTLTIRGVDLSAAGAGKTLIGYTSSANPVQALANIVDCKLGASVTVAATPSTTDGRTNLIRGDSSGTNYRHESYTYQGTQTVETSIIRTSGASDGTTPISWKIVSTANTRWISPFTSIPITIWNDLTGSRQITVYGTTTGGGVPNNDDIWIEAEYLGDASSPLGSFTSTTKTNNLASSTTTNNSSDASTWGGSGAGNGFKMVTPAFTVNQKGYINLIVKVAKVSSTYYIDPLIVIS